VTTKPDKKPDPKANRRSKTEKAALKDLEGKKSDEIKGGACRSPLQSTTLQHNEVMAATRH
jgi:hypothetical protein